MLTSRTSSKKRLFLIAAFLAAFLIVLTVATMTLFRGARTHLDTELGERLRAVAVGLAHTVEASAPGDSVTTDDVSPALYSLLYYSKEENSLSNVVVLTPDGRTVVDLDGYSDPGERNPFIDLDFAAVTLARSGIPSYTSLYRTGDIYMKSAYAPVTSPGGDVIAIVGVEAGAGFFSELRGLSRLIGVITVAGALVVVVLGLLFYRQSRSLDRAEEAMVRKENLATMGRMVANIAHEIRNPLSVIRTSAERLRRKHPDDAEVFTYISEEVDELNRIVTGYLQFAQSQPGEVGECSADKAIARSVLAVQEEADRKRVEISVETGASGPVTLYGDERRLRQALINVLVNAVQATDEGGRVAVRLERDERNARVVVADTGRGIDPKDLSEVTKPFFTRRVGGSGLGLSIVQTILEEHGGVLAIDSRPGEGTRVTLTLPLARSTRQPAAT